LKYIPQSLIVSVFIDLKSFINNRVTTKSSDLNSTARARLTATAYSRMNKLKRMQEYAKYSKMT